MNLIVVKSCAAKLHPDVEQQVTKRILSILVLLLEISSLCMSAAYVCFAGLYVSARCASLQPAAHAAAALLSACCGAGVARVQRVQSVPCTNVSSATHAQPSSLYSSYRGWNAASLLDVGAKILVLVLAIVIVSRLIKPSRRFRVFVRLLPI